MVEAGYSGLLGFFLYLYMSSNQQTVFLVPLSPRLPVFQVPYHPKRPAASKHSRPHVALRFPIRKHLGQT